MASIIAENSVVVDVPLEECFENFNNPDTMSEWFSTPIEVRGFTPPLSAGQDYEVVAKFMGQEITQGYKVLSIDAPNKLVFQTSGVLSGIVTHTCESVNNGTKVTIHAEFDKSGFLAAIPNALVKAPINMQMRGDLKKFKQFIESRVI